MKIKNAIILSAGFGKRLRPLTLKVPKPLLKINNETLLYNSINLLKVFGVKKIIVNVHYLPNKIIKYLKKKKFNLKIIVLKEKKILDTGGAIYNALKFFRKDPFFVINPDTIWRRENLSDMKRMAKKFSKKNCEGLLLLSKKRNSFDKSLKGDFIITKKKLVRRIKKNRHIYTGMQILNPKSIKSKKKIFSINDTWNELIKKNALFGIESKHKFYHVTNLVIYNKLLKIFPNENHR